MSEDNSECYIILYSNSVKRVKLANFLLTFEINLITFPLIYHKKNMNNVISIQQKENLLALNSKAGHI